MSYCLGINSQGWVWWFKNIALRGLVVDLPFLLATVHTTNASRKPGVLLSVSVLTVHQHVLRTFEGQSLQWQQHTSGSLSWNSFLFLHLWLCCSHHTSQTMLAFSALAQRTAFHFILIYTSCSSLNPYCVSSLYYVNQLPLLHNHFMWSSFSFLNFKIFSSSDSQLLWGSGSYISLL